MHVIARLRQSHRHPERRGFFFRCGMGGHQQRCFGRCFGPLHAVAQIEAIDMKTAHMRCPEVPVQKRRQGEQGHEDDHDPLTNACDENVLAHPVILICEQISSPAKPD